MKKVGIVTFHRALNNGAVLQAIALEKTINKLGVKGELVDYRCDKLEQDYALIKWKRGLKEFLVSLKYFPQMKIQSKNFINFRQKFVNMSDIEYTEKNINKANDNYDLFITGSDQVWSPTCAGFDRNYFLSFANEGKKFSYAASFGTNSIPDSLKDEYVERLKGFPFISCREENAPKVLEGLYSKEIYCNIDPVFLLEQQEWKKMIDKPIIEGEYIFVFRVNIPISLFNYAVMLSKKHNMKLVYADGKRVFFDDKVEYISGVSPDILLNLISNSSIMVTNSFHGVAFSTIFHKKLFTELNTTLTRNTRAEQLLKKFNVPYSEIINDHEAIEYSSGNWEDVEKNVKSARNQSIEYLNKVINIDKGQCNE